MFDSLEASPLGLTVLSDDEYYARRLADLDQPEEIDFDPSTAPDRLWTARDDEWLDAAVEFDPERPRSAAEVLDEATTAPVTVEGVRKLARLDARQLDDADKVRLTVAWSRVENFACARKVRGVAAYAGTSEPESLEASFGWAEIGAALHLGDGVSANLIHDACRFAHPAARYNRGFRGRRPHLAQELVDR
jgi:hypothetical protein